ncbi:hypothetical protein X777_04021 [Ooceraea biroi]|uniref:Uncharacterized protein n=1 Tax=Ooceraea biroi TaxID=2015173 RepID=A0A026WJJ1_OOCBI|nr:hypothetical protein X777_04021 [Ooceraea biroi]
MPAPTSAAGAAEGGPPRTELQELQLKAGQTTDEVSRETRICGYVHVYTCVLRVI